MIHLDLSKPFFIEANASLTGIGAILSQATEDGKLHPVEFFSHGLNATEQNYDTHDRELLAVVEAFKKWRPYLIQSPHQITVFSDHHSLAYFCSAHSLVRRQMRWKVTLGEYDFVIKHRAGRKSDNVDFLSRNPLWDDGQQDNKEEILLEPEHFVNAISDSEGIHFMIKREQLSDPLCLDLIMRPESNPAIDWTYDLNDGLWRYLSKIYVPESLQQTVFSICHSSITAGHPGTKPTIKLVARNFYWPELKQDITQWVKNCDSCQRFKTFPGKKSGLLHPNEIPTKPWEIVTMDFLTDLPESEGYDAILVVVDRFSKMIRLI